VVAQKVLEIRFLGAFSQLTTAKQTLLDAFRILLLETSSALRLDRAGAILVVIALVIHVPLIGRSTDNVRLLAAFVNDEPALTMGLDAMTVRPYANPANFYYGPAGTRKAPGPEWGSIGYTGFTYYGGAYLDFALLAYWPLKAIGAPVFPTAPLILRTVSVLAGTLSLLALYNFGRRYATPAAGLLGAVFLLSDSYFGYYTSIIHPDTLQLLVGLLALFLAIRHARDGELSSLLALGLMIGISQGTKAGGPWLIPMSLVAIWFGASIASPPPSTKRFPTTQLFLGGLALLGLASIAMFFVTTPYAFVDRYYWYAMNIAWTLVSQSPLGHIGLEDWLARLYQHFGTAASIVLVAGIAVPAVRVLTGRYNRAIVLVPVLALTQLLWFGLAGGLWIQIGYLMTAYALASVFGFDALLGMLRAASKWTGAEKIVSAAAIVVFVFTIFGERWHGLLSLPLTQLSRDTYTVVEINRWFINNGISRDARILHDDTAYFDPKVFKNAEMRGGVLIWPEVWLRDPEYIVLSSSLYDAEWYQRKRAGPRPNRKNTDPFSVRLYQDLAEQTTLGPTGVPGVNMIGMLEPTRAKPEGGRSSPTAAWMMSMLRAVPVIGLPIAGWCSGQLASAADVARLWANVRGERRDSQGPTLKVYRRGPPGGPEGRETAFSDGTQTGYLPIFAFDGYENAWVSDRAGKAAEGAYVGYDFGGGGSIASNEVSIRWIASTQTPSRVRIEVSDDASTWRSAGEFQINYGHGDANYREDRFALHGEFQGRYWRLVATEVPNDRRFGVTEVTFSRGY
jgi:hypothetical protein